MSAAELEPPSAPSRRIRHDVRDGLAAAAVSLVGSVMVTAVVWLALRWVG